MAAPENVVTTLDAAREFVLRGWCVVPVPRGKKAPVLEGWPHLRLKEEELPRYFSGMTNIGLLLGKPSGGVIDIDLDAPEAIAVADFFLPKTCCVHGRATKRRSHRWYHVSPSPAYVKFVDPLLGKSDPRRSVIVELRQDGHQTIMPPSLHESGELYVWDQEGEPAQANAGDLTQRVHILAAAALLARYWPAQGQRHEAALAQAGMLLRAGWNGEKVSHFVGAVAAAAGDEEQRQRVRDVVSTAERLNAGRSTTGAPTLAQIIDHAVVQRVREWLGIMPHFEVKDPQGWSDPSPLGDELPLVQDFSLEFLPVSFRPLVEDLSERMQTPQDFAGAAAIVALAGCVNRRAIIRPKAIDDSWAVIPNLWGAIVAPPGFMKSPVLHSVTRPLAKIQEFWHADYEQQASDHERTREEEELKLQAWREQNKQAYKTGKPAPLRPDSSASPPTEKRLLLTDSTYEKLHEILSHNPGGVLVLRDELTGWLAGLDRQGHEGERAFYLQAWNGDEGFTVDRIGRGSIFVPAACVSLLGNIQPARLRSYLSEVTAGGPNDDGLFQRIQIFVWPDPPRTWRSVDRKPSSHALGMADKIFGTLAAFSVEDPIQMNFDPEAQQLFNKWHEDLERLVRSEHGLSPSLVGHLSKYRSLMPTLAGLFEAADRVSEAGDLSGHCQIRLNHARQAAAFCDYLESHARRVYSCVIAPECRAARELARHIQAKDVSEVFTARSVYLKGWSGLDSPERVRGALSLLEDAAWVRRTESTPSPTGGRPSEDWMVNPEVFHHEKK